MIKSNHLKIHAKLMILGTNNWVVLGNNPKWAFQVDNERTEYIVNILLITLFIIGSEKKQGFNSKCRSSWRGIGHWGTVACKNLELQLRNS